MPIDSSRNNCTTPETAIATMASTTGGISSLLNETIIRFRTIAIAMTANGGQSEEKSTVLANERKQNENKQLQIFSKKNYFLKKLI